MVWAILFAMTAEAGGHRVHPGPDRSLSIVDPATNNHAPAASRTLSVGRKSWHRSSRGCLTLNCPEEFDTEEVDETWMLQLDAIASLPGTCPGPCWVRSDAEPRCVEDFPTPLPSYFPLRC